jgi:glycosyltransferase involved in cell wall biosynthesis
MVVHAYYPIGETRVERQAQALSAQGTEVDVICLRSRSEPAHATIDGVEVHRLPVKRRAGGLASRLFEYLSFFALTFVRLTGLHLRRRYNVIQVHNLPDFLVFAALIPKLTGAQVILDLHDLMPEFYAERYERSLDSLPVRLVLWQERMACRFADHIITVTELWRRVLIGRGQPADKVSVVMNVADDRIFHRHVATDMPGDGDGRQHELDAGSAGEAEDDGRLRLIYHGTIDRRYGLDLALRAINLVRQAAPDIHLTIHGGGEHRQTLMRMVDELDLHDHVQFSTHFVSTAELPKLIRRADLGIVPYRNGVFTGGILPTKLMEYAALGMPAIAARTPAVAAHFDETTVQLFTPGDVDELAHCILTLYRDRARLASLASNVEKFNERYNWPDQREAYLQLVDRLVECKD